MLHTTIAEFVYPCYCIVELCSYVGGVTIFVDLHEKKCFVIDEIYCL